MPKQPKQANIQGSGIITGDVNISIQIPERERQDKYHCCVCKRVDRIVRHHYMHNGNLYSYCDICHDACLKCNEKIKERM